MILQPKRLHELYPTDILFQSSYWGKVKKRLGWRSYAFDFSPSEEKKDILVLVRSLGKNTVGAYVPQGPELLPKQEDYGPCLEALSESLARQIGDEIAFIRYDLPWESAYSDEISQGCLSDYPESRVREMRMNFNTNKRKLKKAPQDMTISHCCIVELSCSRDKLLSRMKPKTRYNIGLARKKGVRAGLCSASKLPLFYDLYCQTARRNGFEISNYRSFETLFSTSGYDRDKAEIVLLMATHGSDPLAAAIVAISEKGALFLHGASGNIKRNYMGSYALHWEAIQYAQARGCNVYDMGAVSPGPDPDDYFYGLFRFKSGFGGRIVHKIGTWDYPVKNDIYLAFRNWEASVTGS